MLIRTETLRFSVVVPLFNKAEFVVDTIRSALSQTLPALEVIVIDDGSTDDSVVRVQGLADSRIRLIRQPNAGPGAARNRGIAAAGAEWVALLDADDLWRPNHLSTLAELAAAMPNADLVCSSHLRLPITEAIDAQYSTDAPLNAREIDYLACGNDMLVHTSSLAVRRSAMLATAGFGPWLTGEDVELWIRLALEHQFAHTSRVTSVYARGTGGLMEQSQAEMTATTSTPESPIFATIAQLLTDPNHASRHKALHAFADAKRVQFSRSLIYNGQNKAALSLLAGVSRVTPQALAMRVLAHLPRAGLLKWSRRFSAIKRRLGHQNI